MGQTLMTIPSKISIPIVLLLTAGVVYYGFISPACACTTPDAAIAAHMKSGLRNMVLAQDTHRADHRVYAADLASLGPLDFPDSTNVTLETTDSSGYRAVATNPFGSGIQCALAIGVFHQGPAREGEVTCEYPMSR